MRLVRVAVNAEQLLYRSPGGIGRYTAQLLTVLPASYPGDEVVPFTARHERDEVVSALVAAGASTETAFRTKILGLPRPVLYDCWLRFGRPRLPDFGGADLVHAPSVAVPPHPRVPLVVTVHDAAAELFPEAFPRRGRRFHRAGMAAAAKRADLVIAVSEAAADEIAAHSEIPADRIRVVHNGISPPFIDAETRDVVFRRYSLRPGTYVLWIGSLEPRKGVGTLVKAMAELRGRGKVLDFHLVLAGYEGWLDEGLVSPEDRAALGESLHQLGRLTELELWALYTGATLFAFPSDHEGFGFPVVEAMSQSVPVVASDIAAIREVTAGTVRLVAPGKEKDWADALEDLLLDETERSRLAEAGRARSELFTVESMVAKTRRVYEELGA
jgi:glycosyltransferase involved in cell wall biosynthesis